MVDLPAGTVTFLFTDVEGSTRLWEEHPDAMRAALAQHDDLLRACIESHGGKVFKTMGDAFCAVFADPRGAVNAILASQQWLPALALETPDGPRPLRVRMALHAGVAEAREGDYFGPTLNRVARLLAIGHGGQVLLSGAVRELVDGALPEGAALADRGVHRLKDLQDAEAVFQLLHSELESDYPPLRSLSTHPNNLPQQLASFIGRDKEIEQLRTLMSRSRLVTLTGSGGCGKTRLALQVAAEALEQFPDGIWLAEFAALPDPALVPQTVADVLGVEEEPGRPVPQTLAEQLKDKQLLLVLDNCEHLLDAGAKLADALLRQCPRVRILATSREALGIAGETTFRVPSLSLPDPDGDATPASLSRFEAVRLFIERAAQVRTGFTVTNQNAPSVASVCCRLDGIPLAIELAAARVRSLTVEDINGRLDQRFRLLTGGSRTALPRQQTLRSLVDWSYDLLNEAERALLCRLSVFSGGWTLESAEAVCSDCGLRIADCGLGDGTPESGHSAIRPPASRVPAQSAIEEWEILDLLTSLCDKSLVVPETAGATARYRLLETVRQYARDRLLARREGEFWRDRHVSFFLALAEEAEPQLKGASQQAWLERLETEHDNFRAALEWSIESARWVEQGLRLTGALARFWAVRGHLSEGRTWSSRALVAGRGVESSVRARALDGAGELAYYRGDYAGAGALYEESLAIRRERGDRAGIAASLLGIGNLAYRQGDFAGAQALYEESLAIRRELGDRHGIAASLGNLGLAVYEQGDYGAARARHEESLAILRDLRDWRGIANTLNNLGIVADERGDYGAARARHEESLAILRGLGDRHGIANTLNLLGVVADEQGDFGGARVLLDESLAIRRELGDRHGIALSLINLGNVAFGQGDLAAARALQEEGLAIRRGLGDRGGIAYSLESMAALAVPVGAPLHAARLWGAAERLREAIGSPIPPNERARYEGQVALARAAGADDTAFDAAWAEGRAMTLDQAIADALGGADG